MQFDLTHIQNILDYTFNNQELLRQAFIRRSYSVENGGENNEVLEFIGDSILDLIIVKLLTSINLQIDCINKNSQFHSRYNENQLTEIKKVLVERKMLARKIDEFGLANYLIMGKGEIKNKAQNEDSVKEDLFEAVIGAVVLDSKWDIESVTNVVNRLLKPLEILKNIEI